MLQKPGAGFPTWTRGSADEDKVLTTALASWSEENTRAPPPTAGKVSNGFERAGPNVD